MTSHRPRAPAELEADGPWAACWEDLLCLPKADVAEETLFAEAERLVRACRRHTGGDGIEWFKRELDEGECFVLEQIAAEPFDPDWRRVRAVLAGARAGLEAGPAVPRRRRKAG